MKKSPKKILDIHVGQVWRNVRSKYSCNYILALVDYNGVSLIALENGSNRFRNPVQVFRASDISDTEWDLIAGPKENKFELLGDMDIFCLKKKVCSRVSGK